VTDFDFAVPGGRVTALLLALALAAVAVLGVRDLRTLRAPRSRALLVVLRVATALVAWAVATQPSWASEDVVHAPGNLVVLFDASRSMSVVAGEDGTRAQRAERLAARWRDEVVASRGARESTSGSGGAGSGVARVRVLRFGEGVRESSLSSVASALEPVEDDTRIVAALRQAVETDPEVGAVVLVSDGADHATRRGTRDVDRDAVRRLGVRVHTVSVADGTELPDDAVVSVEADPTAFLRQPGRVRVTLRSTRGGARVVTLRRNGAVVREAVVEVPPAGEASVELPFVLDHTGRHAFTVSVPVAEGDVLPENNERAFVVRVVRDKLRVLLVCGRPSWEQRFLRAFLKRDPAIDLVSFFILRTGADLTMSSPEELALIPFPTRELFEEHLGSFDVVFFENFEFGPYGLERDLLRIRDFVIRGGSFAMLGGDLSFSNGGYAETPLAEVLPVVLPPASEPEERRVDLGVYRPVLRADAASHPLVALGADAASTVALWNRLPELTGLNRFLRARDDARVLLEHPTLRDATGAPLPVLVVGERGRGRVLALATDETWRWGMPAQAAGADPTVHERFWDRALRWLARDPALDPARLTVDRDTVGPRARVRVDAQLRDARYVPLAERRVAFAVIDEGGREVARVEARTDAEGRARATLDAPESPGAHRIVALLEPPAVDLAGGASGVGADEPLAEEVLVVERGGPELADVRARPEVLRALAEATGGRAYASIDDVPPLTRLDASRVRTEGRTLRRPLGGIGGFGLLILLFGTEWIARRVLGRR
jgi:uncharacterized membrane protein